MLKERSSRIVVITTLVLIAGAFVSALFKRDAVETAVPDFYRSVIEMSSYTDTSKALVIGYNYHLLKQFAKDNGTNVHIEAGDRDTDWVDSLKRGSIDILVLPFKDSLQLDSVLMTIPVDSTSYWMVRHDRSGELEKLNRWIAGYHASDGYEATREKFMHVYSPYRSRPRQEISPYDSLIRAEADSLGWDWRMFAALIYSESHFHIEARSKRGAMGLAQLMPATAGRYGVTNPLDPEQNIRAGALFLNKLGSRYADRAADRAELFKFTLAAYNAGEGRIQDCIKYAAERGIEPEYWEDIVSVIPYMRDSTVLENGNLRFGLFKGDETIRYVEAVMDVYVQYLRICP